MPTDIFNFEYLKNHAISLMPPSPIQYIVTKTQQQREIESLKATLGSRRFFFVTNLENFEIEHVYGTGRWLGYSEKDFNMKWYLDHVMHPGKKATVILLGIQLYDALCIGTYALNFMVQRYNSLVALKHYNGKYLLANRISSVFQYDNNNRLTSYLNEFTIIGEYTGQPLSPGFFNEDGRMELRGKDILKATILSFLSLRIFSDRELQVARIMAYNPGIKRAEIVKKMSEIELVTIKESVVKEYQERLKTKAKEIFHKSFKDENVGIFLKNEGLL